jgi:hypothetical protein
MEREEPPYAGCGGERRAAEGEGEVSEEERSVGVGCQAREWEGCGGRVVRVVGSGG